MSAIYGLVGVGDDAVLKRMGDRLLHRGRTRMEWQAGPATWMGCVLHRDESPPVQTRDARTSVVSDIDLFATDTLRSRLGRGGHEFDTDLPEELLLRAYEESGPACLEELNGYFAAAAWDEREQSLTLARDPAGFRPLYVWSDGARLAFASEYKALLAISDIPVTPDLENLQYLQSRKLVPAGKTLLREIHSVMPGSWSVYRAGQREDRRYWQLPLDIQAGTCEEHATRLRDDFLDAVKRQTAGTERIGVSLSGGIDSMCIAAALRRLKPDADVHTFTAGSGPGDGDMHYAARVADLMGTRHHEVVVGPEAVADVLPQVIWHLEDPIARSETVQYYLTARAAKEHVDVLLQGQIADGLYAGMPKHKIVRIAQRLPFLRTPLSEFYNYTQTGLPARSWIGSLLQGLYFRGSIPPVPRIRGGGEIPPATAWPRGKELLNEILRAGTYGGVPQWLPKVDRVHFAHGVRVFSPFIDNVVMRQAFVIPDRCKFRGRQEKYVLRRALRELLPQEFIDRPKYPQRMTYDLAFSDCLDKLASDVLAPDRVEQRGFFEPEDVRRMTRRRPGKPYKAEHAMRIWTALSTEFWARIFLDGRGDRP